MAAQSENSQPLPAATSTDQSPAPTPAADKRRDHRRLGRGLASLISVAPPAQAEGAPGGAASPALQAPHPAHAMLAQLDVESIIPNPDQPRRNFDEQALAGLAGSIRANGLVQPVLVRRRPQHVGGPAEPAAFELVAGERRWRAARMAGVATVPAIVKAVEDDAMLELALTENIQRADLNPVERAAGYKALLERQGISQDVLARKLGESRANVGHYLRLLELPESVRAMLADGRLSFGHAKALMGLKRPASQEKLAEAAAEGGWSVREVEKLVSTIISDPAGESALDAAIGHARAGRPAAKLAPAVRVEPPKPPNILALEEKLTRRLGTRVIIRQGRRADMGKVVIDFYCLDDFDRILDALGVTAD